jgi:D,D-heptose 1,7-bisphosphate phosphatase
MMTKAVFLDRDGTINVDYGYVYRVEDLKLLPGVVEGLLKLQQSGFVLIIITNQSGVGRGYFSEEDVHNFNNQLVNHLSNLGIEIKDIYTCFHAPEDHCSCRKPSPDMILKALKEYDIDPAKSYMIGDKSSDVEAGEASGLTSFLINDNNNFESVTDKILKTNK